MEEDDCGIAIIIRQMSDISNREFCHRNTNYKKKTWPMPGLLEFDNYSPGIPQLFQGVVSALVWIE
jgi:hypothetical protein